MPTPIDEWAESQRRLCRALGLSVESWIVALEAASQRTAGLTAAVIGAAMARGMGLSVLDGLDGAALSARARAVLDPKPPRVENPVLREAIRRAEALGAAAPIAGGGAARLKGQRLEPPTPRRGEGSLGDSASQPTADAPGASSLCQSSVDEDGIR